MKQKLLNTFSPLLLASLIMVGCTSTSNSPEVVAFKTVATIGTTVDSARQAWNTYVQQGHATVDEVTKIAASYVIYQQSMAIAEVAVNSYKTSNDTDNLNKAIAALSQSSSNILALINTLTTKKK